MHIKKPALLLILLCVLIVCIHSFSSCVKKEKDTSTCRTCTAKNYSGTVAATKNVCSYDEEQSFRSEYSQDYVDCQ